MRIDSQVMPRKEYEFSLRKYEMRTQQEATCAALRHSRNALMQMLSK